MKSWFGALALAVAAAAFALPAAAPAASVTYVDGGNVWVASPDGAVKRQVSHDGSAELPYAYPSAADDGEITAIRRGDGSTRVITVFGADGTRTDNVMPWKTALPGWLNVGPTAARVNPTGTEIAYTYVRNHGPYSGLPNAGLVDHLAIVPRRTPGLSTEPLIDVEGGWQDPTWIDGKLVVARGGALHLEVSPLQFTQFLAFDPPNPAEPDKRVAILRGEVSRGHHRYLLHARDWNDVEGLYLAAHTGAFPGGEVPDGCWVPVGPGLDGAWGLSPDGTQVAWSDDNGVHVGTFTPERKRGASCDGPVVTLSATGSQPSFGMATLSAPRPSSGSEPPASTGSRAETPSPESAPVTGSKALRLTVVASVRRTSLTRGLRVTATAPRAGTVSARLSSSGRTLATAKRTARKAGRVMLTLRLTNAGRAAVKRLKGKRVTLKLTFTPKRRGARMTATARVRLT